MHAKDQTHADDVAGVAAIEAVPNVLHSICRTAGMGFAAVARVTDERWIACAMQDDMAFGLTPGGELDVSTTICNEIRRDERADGVGRTGDRGGRRPGAAGGMRPGAGHAGLSNSWPTPWRTAARTARCTSGLAATPPPSSCRFTNSGEPIAPEIADRLFQPFFRAGTQKGGQGLGLGLYIASEIARAHGGALEVTSLPGATQFTFRLPVSN